MLIGLILPAEHPWRIEAPALGTVAYEAEPSSGQFRLGDLGSAARAHLDVLLLDAADLDSADLDAIRSYRIARPQTRIVVSLPEDGPYGQPGSPVLAGFVGMGVYDLMQGAASRVATGDPSSGPAGGRSSLKEALTRSPTYADAVRWTMAGDQDSGTGRRIEVRERIVERRVAASRRPVLVVVAGVGYGVGTTTLARLVAETVREQGQTATLIDAAIMPGASRLLGPTTAARAAPSGKHLATSEIEAVLRGQTGGYVVVDAGRAGESAGLAELARTADAVLFAMPPTAHRLAWAEALVEEHVVPTPTGYVIVGGSETEAAAMVAALKQGGASSGGSSGDKAAPIHHLSLQRPGPSLATILGERLLPAGRRPGMLARLRWRALQLSTVPGGVARLLGTVAQQAAFIVGRLLGLVIVAAALAFIVAIVLPAFGGVHALAHLAAWAQAQYRQFASSLP